MRTFKLIREVDTSGVSGTGLVALGLEDALGRVFLAWVVSAKIGPNTRRPIETLTVFASIQDVSDLHGHGGASHVEIDSCIDLNTVNTIRTRKNALLDLTQNEAA